MSWGGLTGPIITAVGNRLQASVFISGGLMFRAVGRKDQFRNFDPQHGGVVLLGNNIYGANHQSNPSDTWICLDWTTGKTLWTTKWKSGGSIISADEMLYLFEEKSGHVALVKPNNLKLDIVSEFQITKGEGPFWAHPVINKGRLYIRYSDALILYKIK